MSFSSEHDKKVIFLFEKGYKCCSANCSRGNVQRVPLSCIDWQISYCGHLFCADIVEDEQLSLFDCLG